MDMTATITPTRKDRHPSAPPVVPMALLAVALLLGVSTLGRSPAPSVVRAPASVRTLPSTVAPASASTTSSTSTTSTTVAPPLVAPAAIPTTVPTPAPAPPAVSTSCADALAYVSAHAAPGYVTTCAPGSALGHYGYTCANVPGRCDGVRIIHIACPAPFVYMNEAHNSWTVIGQGSGIDPYGQGTPAEQAYCDGFR